MTTPQNPGQHSHDHNQPGAPCLAPETWDRTKPQSAPTKALLHLLRLYQYTISPTLHGILKSLSPIPSGCRFLPTCSEYSSQAIEIHGALHGSRLAITRLLRCHPFSRGGADPVPLPRR